MTSSPQKLAWREEFEIEFSRKILFYENVVLSRKKLKSFIARVEAAALERGKRMKGSAWREGYQQGRQEERGISVKELADAIEMAKQGWLEQGRQEERGRVKLEK